VVIGKKKKPEVVEEATPASKKRPSVKTQSKSASKDQPKIVAVKVKGAKKGKSINNEGNE